MDLAYTLAMPRPESHLFHVELRARAFDGGKLRFVMPAWTPGSYVIRDFARHVQDFTASDGRGRPLPWRLVDKQTWEVDAGERTQVVVRYKVWANELSVQASHLDATHAYGNGTSLFMFVDGAKESPVTLTVKPFRGWRVDVPLPEGPRNVFRAEDYDALVDAPFEIGTHRRLEFRVRGKRHRIALYGRGNEDASHLARDLKRIVEEEAALWGDLPYREYLFIIHLTDRARGGLEHRGSNTSAVERWTFRPGKRYEDFLALEAHEFFHTWNVKRLRPAALGPFDYTREVHTTLLWAMEGITSYYDHLVLARAGLITEERYREFLAETITKLRQQPGRFKLSLADSSFLAWVKLYKQDANWVNTGVSYYLKGELVALCLDLAIRSRTRGWRSLDDVLRHLYEAYPVDGPGIPEAATGGVDGWREAIESVTGLSWRSFWSRYIEGTEEVDFEGSLKAVGWRLRPVLREDKVDELKRKGDYVGPGGWLGAEAKESDRRLLVAHVLHDSPAMAAGVAPEDELVAMDGFQLRDKDAFERRLRERRAGDRVTLHVFRRHELAALTATLIDPPPEKWTIEEAPRTSRRALRERRRWLAALGGKKGKPRAGGESRTRGARARIEETGE